MSEKTEIVISARDDTQSAFAAANRSLQSLGNSARSLVPMLGGIGLAMAGIGAGVGLSTLKGKFDAAVESAAGLKEMADKTGASVEGLSGLAAVAKITATDMGLVETAIGKMAKGLHAADEDSKGVGKALKFIGLNIKDLRGQDPAEVFKLIADKMNELEDGTGKTALGMQIFGKQFPQIAGYMKDLAQSGDLVTKTTNEQAAAAKAYQEDLRRLTVTKDALYKVVSLELAPAFDTFVQALIGAKGETNGMIKTGKELAEDGSIREWGLQAVEVSGWVIDGFQGITRIFQVVGKGLGAMAAEAAAALSGNFAQVGEIEKMYQAEREAILMQPMFSEGLKKRTDALRAHEEQVKAVTKAYEGYGKKVQSAAVKSLNDSFYGTQTGTKSAKGFVSEADPRNKGAKAEKVDDYTKTIQSLNEKIAVETLGIQTTDKLSAAEKEFAKYQADVASGALKLTAAQQTVVGAYWETYRARAKERQEAEEFRKALDAQNEAMTKQRQGMLDQIASAEKSADLYGLSASQINAVTQARMEDAIALATVNGASEEQIAYLNEELRLYKELGDALEKNDLRRLTSGTKTDQANKQAADQATLDRGLAAGTISEKQYKEATDKLQGLTDDMSEFAKQGAHNMQDAMANFFVDPTLKGIKSIGKTFAETVAKMIAQAGSAQLLKLLLGNFGTSSKEGGLLDSIFGNGKKSGSENGIFDDMFSALKGFFGFSSMPSGGGTAGAAPPAWQFTVPQFAVGTNYVPRDMVAKIHEGEAIVPKKFNPSAGGKGGNPVIQHLNFYGAAEPEQVKRAAAAGYRSAHGALATAGRYA